MKKQVIFNLLIFTGFLFLLSSCKVAPKPIQYGKDHCYHCDMTVVDKNFAAEYVTKKGKSYIFDAVECLVMKLNDQKNEDKMAFILVTDYANPGNLVNAKIATYLISEKVKSPMGANLTAFKSNKIAKKYQHEKSGKLFNWDELKANFSN